MSLESLNVGDAPSKILTERAEIELMESEKFAIIATPLLTQTSTVTLTVGLKDEDVKSISKAKGVELHEAEAIYTYFFCYVRISENFLIKFISL